MVEVGEERKQAEEEAEGRAALEAGCPAVARLGEQQRGEHRHQHGRQQEVGRVSLQLEDGILGIGVSHDQTVHDEVGDPEGDSARDSSDDGFGPVHADSFSPRGK